MLYLEERERERERAIVTSRSILSEPPLTRWKQQQQQPKQVSPLNESKFSSSLQWSFGSPRAQLASGLSRPGHGVKLDPPHQGWEQRADDRGSALAEGRQEAKDRSSSRRQGKSYCYALRGKSDVQPGQQRYFSSDVPKPTPNGICRIAVPWTSSFWLNLSFAWTASGGIPLYWPGSDLSLLSLPFFKI